MPNRRIEEEALDAADLRQNPSAVPRVYVVSDVRLYREGLISSLARQSELNVLGAGSSGEFLGRIGDLQPEALLLDLAAHDGFAIPRRAQEILPSLRVVAFAVGLRRGGNFGLCHAGRVGHGFGHRDFIRAQGRAGMLAANRGTPVNRLANLCSRRSAPSAVSALTPREREIAALVACNLPNKEIAVPRRSRTTCTTFVQKLNIHRRGEIAGLRPRCHYVGRRSGPVER